MQMQNVNAMLHFQADKSPEKSPGYTKPDFHFQVRVGWGHGALAKGGGRKTKAKKQGGELK
jgi:hypothetical protein